MVIVLAELFNPADGILYHSFAGVRQNIEFVPLFFLGYAYVRTVRALRVFVIVLVTIGAANGIVSTLQFNKTPAQLASWGPGYAERVLSQGGFSASARNFYTSSGTERVRPFGLGSDAGDGGLLGALALGGLVALASLVRKRWHLLLVVALAAATVLAIVTSQGRGAIVCAITIVVAYAALAAGSGRAVRTLLAFGMGAAVAGIVISQIISSAGSSAFRYASIAPSRILSTASTDRGQSWAAIPTYVVEYPFGAGLGVAGAAAGTRGAPAATGNVNGENELTFATLETGVPGMLIIVGFTLTLCVTGIRRCRMEPDPEARLLLAATIAPLFGLVALYPTFAGLTGAVPGAPYLWASGGILAYWLYTRQASLGARG